MPSLPLHPVIVHLPVGLAFVMPLVATFVVWASWKGCGTRRGWTLVVALQALLLAGGLAALKTGQDEEDLVERVVPRAAIHEHEEYAEQLLWASGLVLGLAFAPLVARSRRAVHALSALTVLGTLVVAGLAVRAGHAGGQLVYVHGAAAAHVHATAVLEDPDRARRGEAGEHNGDER